MKTRSRGDKMYQNKHKSLSIHDSYSALERFISQTTTQNKQMDSKTIHGP